MADDRPSLFQRLRGRSTPRGEGRPSGRSATVNTRGFISDEERNIALMHPLNLRIYDEMRKTDPTVRWMLALLKTPIIGATWDYEPASNDPEDQEIAAFCRKAVFEELDGGFTDLLRRALTYLEMGHSVLERVTELREIEFEIEVEEIVVDEAEPVDVPPPQAVNPLDPSLPPPPPLVPASPEPRRERTTRTVKREAFVVVALQERLQRSITEWHADERRPARLDHIRQFVGDGREPDPIDISADRLLVFTNEKEGDDWRGLSVLRSAWRAYEYIFRLENIEALAYDRSAGLPVVYPPDDASEPQLAKIDEMLGSIRAGENLWARMPGPKQGTTKESRDGWLFEEVQIKGDADRSPNEAIERYKTDLARNIQAEFMRLGHENVGARSTGEVQQDPYYLAEEAVVSYVEEVLHAGLTRPLVDWNYEAKRYPRLTASKIQAKNLQVVADSAAKLMEKGGIEPTPELEAWFRELLDAPEKPLELDAPKPPAPSQPPPPADSSKPDPGEGPGPGESGGEATDAKPPPRAMSRSQQFSQFTPRRALQGAEEHVAWQQIQDTLDNGPEDLLAAGERVMAGQLESLQSLADQAVRENKPELLDELALDPEPLAEALEEELGRLYATGRADVRAEVRRQQAAAGAERELYAQPPKIPLSASDIAKVVGGLARNVAEQATAAAIRAVKTRALKTISQRRETPPRPGEVPDEALRAALRAGATPAVNRIYSLGRMDELRAQHNAGLVQASRYSALLDGATCAPCEDWDGTVVAAGQEIPLPNAECEGGDRCRCEWVPELAPPADLST